MKDYLEENGLVVNPAASENTIKEAFGAKLVDDGQVWIDMMLHRNLLSHTYDIKVFEEVLQEVDQKYLPALDRLHEFLSIKRTD